MNFFFESFIEKELISIQFFDSSLYDLLIMIFYAGELIVQQILYKHKYIFS